MSKDQGNKNCQRSASNNAAKHGFGHLFFDKNTMKEIWTASRPMVPGLFGQNHASKYTSTSKAFLRNRLKPSEHARISLFFQRHGIRKPRVS
jgi:hypothetical protein